MNYKRIYESLCRNAVGRTIDCYGENHHVQPKCLGGSNSKTNIVRLTAKEHYLAHKLLCRIFPENYKLVYAFWMMCNGSRPERPITNSRNYQEAKALFSIVAKTRISALIGRKHTQETKDKISNSKSGNTIWKGRKHSDESKLKQSESAKTRKINPEVEAERRRKISEKMKGVPKSTYYNNE